MNLLLSVTQPGRETTLYGWSFPC